MAPFKIDATFDERGPALLAKAASASIRRGPELVRPGGLPALTVTPGPDARVRIWGLPEGCEEAIVNGLRLEGARQGGRGSRWESRAMTESERVSVVGIPL